MQPIDLNGGGDTVLSAKSSGTQQIQLMQQTQQTQPIDLNGGGDTVLSAKSSPTQQIKPMQQTQPIDSNMSIHLMFNTYLRITSAVIHFISQLS